MPFTIPNLADAGFAAQAAPDSGDLSILANGFGRTGVLTGCGVTAATLMNVAVAAGTIEINAVSAAVTANATLAVGTAHATLPRIDLIYTLAAGTPTVAAGTAAANPVYPALPANSVILAAVYVPATLTTILSSHLTDKRVVLTNATGWVLYGGTAGSTGAASANVTAWATAQTALPATGGTIFVKSGTYWVDNVSTISLNNVRVRGEPGAIFKLMPASNQVVFAIGNQASYTTGVTFENIEIDGNAINQTTATTSGLATTYGVIGLLCYKTYQVTIQNCYIHDTLGSGIQVNSCGQVNIFNNVIQNSGMVRSYSRGGAITGITNVTNPVVTTATAHSLVNGQLVTIAGVAGAMGTAVNANWTVSAVTTFTYTITRSVPGAAWTSGGTTAYAGFYQCNSVSIYQDSQDAGVHPAYGFQVIGNAVIGVCDNGLSANGNGSQGYVIADNDISGRVTDLTGFAAAYWGIALELESGDTIADHLCAITGNIIKDQNYGVILVQYIGTSALVMQGVSIAGNTISNCAVAFQIGGQNITLTGNTAFNVNEFLNSSGNANDVLVVNRSWVIANNSFTLTTTGGPAGTAATAGGIILRGQPNTILDGIVVANNSGIGTGTTNLNSWHAGVVTEINGAPTGGSVKNVVITGNQFRSFGMGIWVKTIDPVMISGNHCIQNGDSGIAITGFNNVGSVITSNVCVDNGRQAVGSTWDAGIEIDCTDAMLRDNRCYDTAPGAGSAEVQTLSQANTPTGGTFTLSYLGQTTTALAFNASAATVGTAINLLSTIIAAGGVGVPTGGPFNTTNIVITFSSAGLQTLLVGNGAALTGAGSQPTATVVKTTPGVDGKRQLYGVRVSGSTVLSTMDGDDLRGNATSAIGFLGLLSFTSIRNVRGYNPVGKITLPRTGTANTIPATPITTTTYTNDTGYDCTVYIKGTITVIAVGGQTTGLVATTTIPVTVGLAVGQTMAITGSASLSWVWFAD